MSNPIESFININRYNQKMLELFCVFSSLQDAVGKFILDPSEAHLSLVADTAKNAETKFEIMKSSLLRVVKEISGSEENGDIDTEETQDGFRV